jgi:PAS domain S-box-containing protein
MKDEEKPKALLIEELVELRRRIAKTEKAEGRDDLRILMASVLDSIHHAVIGLKDRNIIFANHAVLSLFGWHPEEILGQGTRILYRSDEEYNEIANRFYPALEKSASITKSSYADIETGGISYAR